MGSSRHLQIPTRHARRLSKRLPRVPSVNCLLDAALPHRDQALLAEDLPFVVELIGFVQVRLSTAEWTWFKSLVVGDEVLTILAVEVGDCVFTTSHAQVLGIVPIPTVVYAALLNHRILLCIGQSLSTSRQVCRPSSCSSDMVQLVSIPHYVQFSI